MKIGIDTIPTCPLCRTKRNVGAVKSIIGKKIQRTYFCTSCMVEFNRKGTLYPPIREKRTS